MPNPSVLYATDEDIKVRCSGDYDMLVPVDQVLAAGTDGAIAPAAPWVLTSLSTGFAAAGIAAGNVLRVRLPGASTPAHFAVVSAAGNALTFRRIGLGAGQGQPLNLATTAGLTFSIPTFAPQIEDASYDLNRRFNINDDFADHAASYLYDRRELRQACVLTVLKRQYAIEARDKEGDFGAKLGVVAAELADTLARISVRFGALGQGAEPVNRFSTRLRR